MIGRMGDQSVVISAEKGKVKMLVDGADPYGEKELVYDVRKDIDQEGSQSTIAIVLGSPAKPKHKVTVPMTVDTKFEDWKDGLKPL